MKKSGKKNFRALLMLLLSMTMAFVLVFSASCGDTESASESDSESASETDEDTTPVDEQTIANGDFEFYTTSSTSYPYSSSVKWTRSLDKGVVSAPSSSATSGIIDVSQEAYAKLADGNKPTDKDDEEKYINPGTPFSVDDDKTEANEAGTKILMIHNKNEGEGSAQYFTSSETITLAPEKTAKISVWVRTDNLKSYYAQGDMKDFGAYIKIRNTVNKEIKPLLIKNINTKGEWVNYVIYLKPSTFAVTKYQVVLGLGIGDSSNVAELCDGFAFFDNVEYSIVEDYATVEGIDKDFSLYNGAGKSYLDKENADYNANVFVQSEAGKDYTDNKTIKYRVSFAKEEYSGIPAGDFTANEVNPNTANHAVYDYKTAGKVEATSTEKEITVAGGETVTVPANSIYMNFDGEGSSYTFESQMFGGAYGSFKKNSYVKLSVRVLAVADGNSKNVSIVISDNGTDSSDGTFSDITAKEYTRYTFYVANKFDEDITTPISIKLSFGPTELTSSSSYWDLPVGYAIFTDFSFVPLTEAEYNSADTTTDTHAVKVVLKGDHANEYDEEDEEDSDKYEDIKEGYSFAITDSNYVSIEKEPIAIEDFTTLYRSTAGNENSVVGLINSKFKDTYKTGEYLSAADALVLEELESKASTKYVQPIVINNKTSASTGIICSKATVSSFNAYKFEVKVRVVGDAVAYVYLVDMAKGTYSFGNNDSASALYPVYNFKTTDNVGYENIDESLFVKVDNTIVPGADGYVTVNFYVVAGEDALSLRLEVWNGDRKAGDDVSTGCIFIDGIDSSISDYTSYEALKGSNTFSNGYFTTEKKYNQGKVYHYYEGEDEEKVIDDDGNHVYTVASDYVAYAESKDKAVKFVSANVLSKTITVEKETDSSSESSSEEESTSDSDENEDTVGNLVWLQITSIIIAAILVIVLVAIVLRKVFEKRAKKKEKTRGYYVGYNRDTRRLPEVRDVEAPEDTNEEYDYGEETDKE